MNHPKVYFRGINTIRVLAVWFVILDHTNIRGHISFLQQGWGEDYNTYIGMFGVSIFLVLSGFLNTFLLLQEKQHQQKINLSRFYVRRAARLYPLYFLLIILSFFVIPHFEFFSAPNLHELSRLNFWISFGLFCTFLTNVALVYFPHVPFANILWTTAVQEQFYWLCWIYLINLKKYLFGAMLGVLLVYMVVKIMYIADYNNPFHFFIDRTRFSCLIIGGMGAFLVHKKSPKILTFLYSYPIQIVAIVLFFYFLKNPNPVWYYYYLKTELMAIIIMVLIVNIATNPKSILKLEHRLFNYLSKISYGIYIYHLFAILILRKIFMYAGLSHFSLGVYGLFVFVVFLLSVLISHISFHYFEKLFVRLRPA